MVAEFFIMVALAAAPAAARGASTPVEVRVTAIIQQGVTLQNGHMAAPGDIAPVRQMPRDCGLADERAPGCRLIVDDLP